MSTAPDLEAAIKGVRQADTPKDLLEYLAKTFGFWNNPTEIIEAYDALVALAGTVDLAAPSALDLYELKIMFRNAPQTARNAFFEESRADELLRHADEVTPRQVFSVLTETGNVFLEKHADTVRALTEAITRVGNMEKEYEKIITEKRNWFEKIQNQRLAENHEYQEIFGKLRIYMSEIDKLYEDKIEFLSAEHTKEEVDEYNKSYTSAVKPIVEAMEALQEREQKLYSTIMNKLYDEAHSRFPTKEFDSEARARIMETVQAQEEALFADLTRELGAGISEEQALAWAERNTFIDENAAAKLKRKGYPPERLQADLAEVYRLTGGKLGPVQFVLEGRSQRAFARGATQIAVQGNFDKATLFHECGHLAEAWNPAASAACMEFISQRAQGRPVSLKRLTGLNYQRDEVAFPDSFINPYVGKVYADGVTEVLSISLQCFARPQDLALLAAKDPEHCKLILGICARKSVLVDRRLDATTEQVAQKHQQHTRQKAWEKALDRVSGPAFGKLLMGPDPYKGFRLIVYGRSGRLDRMGDDGRQEVVYRGAATLLRRLAYLLIASAEGRIPLAPDEDPRSAAYQAQRLLQSGLAPDWFNPDDSLPKV